MGYAEPMWARVGVVMVAVLLGAVACGEDDDACGYSLDVGGTANAMTGSGGNGNDAESGGAGGEKTTVGLAGP